MLSLPLQPHIPAQPGKRYLTCKKGGEEKGVKGETNYTLNLDLQGPKDEQSVSFYKSSRFASISRRATGGASVRQQKHSLEPKPDLTQSRSRRKNLQPRLLD